MKIGVMRHFKVDYKAKDMMNSDEFEEYIRDYDIAPVIKKDVNFLNNDWDKCYCSDLERAYITASDIYRGEIIKSELLREVKMYPVIKCRFRIPTFIWCVLARVSWKLNLKSQLEGRKDTELRVKKFLKTIDLNKNENILIVCHGFFLLTLIKELKSLGFRGDIPKNMMNAKLYILEKS